uniref:Uncharacterized protein n=1 Tax=Rhizophora mucronata TaxID=61149 RepID=A0A2P2LVS2_RHIMU
MDEDTKAIDRISGLPPFVIHNIMSLLSAKEVVQTSVLSKTWYRLRESHPILEFDQSYFVGQDLASIRPKHFSHTQREQFSESIGNFTKFVEDSLQRFSKLNFRLKKFRLSISLIGSELCSTVDKWIELAIGCGVREFILHVKTDEDGNYTVPETVLSAKCISNLDICGCSWMHPFARYNIQLQFLENLSLDHVHVNEEMIQKLTKECPLLENLSLLNCWGLKRFDLSKLIKLKDICLVVKDLESIKIVAPSLQTFILHTGIGTELCMIDMVECKNLRSLHLLCVKIADQEFHNLISMFSLLEHLVVHHCAYLGKVNISSKQLKSLTLLYNTQLEDVEIDTPNLLQFSYRSCKVPQTYSINAPCKWFVDFVCHDASDTLWYLKVKKFLRTTNQLAKLGLSIISSKDLPDLHGLREDSPSLPCEVENVFLLVVSPVSNYQAFLDYLLWVCYPKNLSVLVNPLDEVHFYKWFFDELMKRQVNCCTSDRIQCWRHYLKGIKIENFKRDEDAKGPFSLDALMDSQPTPPSGTITFSLQWHSELPSMID